MIELECAVQKYAWGKRGESSAVARIKVASDITFQVSQTETYAELWMGTHPNGPSKVKGLGVALYQWLQESGKAEGMVGSVPDGYPKNDIPYMLKVLSIETALSIQAHPDKQLAPILHAAHPDIYKDPNHKPEMCIALTSLEALKGFRPCTEIQANLSACPELREVIGEEPLTLFHALCEQEGSEAKALECLFGAFLRCPAERASKCVGALVSRLSSTEQTFDAEGTNSSTYLNSLMLRLHSDYPNDPGVFGPLLMNCLNLKAGEAFFMQANEPHAYVAGDIVEVMALSDNVVRAGLTPKFKDVETMCKMLEYKCTTPEMSLVMPIQLDPYCALYRPPSACCQEFEIEMVNLPANTPAYKVSVLPCSSILLFIHGNEASCACLGDTSIMQLYDGATFFLPANESIEVVAGSSRVSFYRSHINLGDL